MILFEEISVVAMKIRRFSRNSFSSSAHVKRTFREENEEEERIPPPSGVERLQPTTSEKEEEEIVLLTEKTSAEEENTQGQEEDPSSSTFHVQILSAQETDVSREQFGSISGSRLKICARTLPESHFGAFLAPS